MLAYVCYGNYCKSRKSTVPTAAPPAASRAQVDSHAPEALITYRVSGAVAVCCPAWSTRRCRRDWD